MRLPLLLLLPLAGAAPAAASPHGQAVDRCLVLGFRDPTNQALCTEFELGYPEPAKIGLGALNGPQNKCMVLGFKDEGLAACTQRQLRNIPVSAQPPYRIHDKP